jgi:outer membrane protein assembly factor BamB
LFGIYLDEEDDDEPIYCFAYDLERSDFSWKHRISRAPKALTMSEQQIFISDKKGSFTCLSAATGSQVWTTSLKEIGQFKDIDKTVRSGDVTGIPLLWADMVIVPVEGYRVAAFSQASGEVRWSQQIDIDDPRNVVCSPEGNLIIVDCEICISLDVTTGQILSQLNIDAAVQPHGGPLLTRSDVTNGFLYFSTIDQGVLVALDRQSGEIPWSFKCAAPVPINNAPVVVDGRLYLVDESGSLYVFTSG